jgi:hypothetical protein
MKNILLLALLAVATIEANATTAGQTPTEKMTKKERKAARQAKSPQVYKGTVAEQRRLVTDAPGAESEDGEGTTTKGKKSKNKE